MEQILYSEIKITDNRILTVKLYDIKTDEIKDEATITIDDFEIMKTVESILPFPLKEVTHSLYNDGYKLNSVLNNVLKQAIEQCCKTN